MGNAARKARKRAGIPYAGHPVKVGTPLHARAVPMVLRLDRATGIFGEFPSNRALNRIEHQQKVLARAGIRRVLSHMGSERGRR